MWRVWSTRFVFVERNWLTKMSLNHDGPCLKSIEHMNISCAFASGKKVAIRLTIITATLFRWKKKILVYFVTNLQGACKLVSVPHQERTTQSILRTYPSAFSSDNIRTAFRCVRLSPFDLYRLYAQNKDTIRFRSAAKLRAQRYFGPMLHVRKYFRQGVPHCKPLPKRIHVSGFPHDC